MKTSYLQYQKYYFYILKASTIAQSSVSIISFVASFSFNHFL